MDAAVVFHLWQMPISQWKSLVRSNAMRQWSTSDILKRAIPYSDPSWHARIFGPWLFWSWFGGLVEIKLLCKHCRFTKHNYNSIIPNQKRKGSKFLIKYSRSCLFLGPLTLSKDTFYKKALGCSQSFLDNWASAF